jgi:hypothetical protein
MLNLWVFVVKLAVWKSAVDLRLQCDWCLSVEDAGIDEAQLSRAWTDGETPEAFVAWFAEKYDLIRFEPWPIRRWKAHP